VRHCKGMPGSCIVLRIVTSLDWKVGGEV